MARDISNLVLVLGNLFLQLLPDVSCPLIVLLGQEISRSPSLLFSRAVARKVVPGLAGRRVPELHMFYSPAFFCLCQLFCVSHDVISKNALRVEHCRSTSIILHCKSYDGIALVFETSFGIVFYNRVDNLQHKSGPHSL